jgi:aryl-alcohol dehydrogenase-like predicted oxidoreductase
MTGLVPQRPFGTTGETISSLGVGGFHIGVPEEAEGIRIIQTCIDAGANFLDNAWEYNDGESERRMGKALAQDGYRHKAFLMTKDCAHDRKANHSMLKLEQSLKRLKTDYLDLWQLHEVVWEDDPDWIFAPGGSAEALLKAKEQGKVRYIGFTGHKDPEIHRKMLSHGFPFDAVQMPINVFDAHYRSFESEIVPICQEQGIAVLGMKTLAGGYVFQSGTNITAAEAIRYALDRPVATVISGMSNLAQMEHNLAVARDFAPLTEAERADLLARSKPAAGKGEFERFKTTRQYDANEGRVAHNHPLMTPDETTRPVVTL